MFRIDFHSHTGHSPDAAVPAASLLDGAVRAGLATLCVTDHNTIDGGRQAASIVARRPDRYPGLSVIIGEEVMTSEGEVIGLFLTTTIPRGLTPEETIRRIRDQGGLVTVPHPFDRLRGSRLRSGAIQRIADAGLIDAIEGLNARVTFSADNDRAIAFARAYQLPVVAGSDAHTAGEVGRAWVALDEPPGMTTDILRAQLEATRVTHAHPHRPGSQDASQSGPQPPTGHAIGGQISSPLVHLGSSLARWQRRLGLLPDVVL